MYHSWRCLIHLTQLRKVNYTAIYIIQSPPQNNESNSWCVLVWKHYCYVNITNMNVLKHSVVFLPGISSSSTLKSVLLPSPCKKKKITAYSHFMHIFYYLCYAMIHVCDFNDILWDFMQCYGICMLCNEKLKWKAS